MKEKKDFKQEYESIKVEHIFKSQEDKSERWEKNIERHPLRSNFQRDRDRILYSRAFRRLSGKTQVFRTGNDDHIRTRLTHTLEVSQIARTISKELGLDEDLTEAIALGHDLGHTPFGHVGERTLNQIMNGSYIIEDFNKEILKKGFKHNLQSARVVNELEEVPLYLTKETIFGIMHHSSMCYKECDNLDFYDYVINGIDNAKNWSLEALVVAMADEIAQRHHDIEDAIEFKIISQTNLYNTINECFGTIIEENPSHHDTLEKIRNNKTDKYEMISNFSKFIVDFLTTDLINESKKNIIEMKNKFEIKSSDDFYSKKAKIYNDVTTFSKEDKKNYIFNVIKFSDKVKKGDKELQRFLKNRILKSFEAQRMDGLGSYIIKKLFEAYTYNPQQLNDKTIKILNKNLHNRIKSKNSDKCNLIKGIEILEKTLECTKDTEDVGEIRNVIQELHYEIKDENSEVNKIYKDVLLRTICYYIAGMTDSYALNEHKVLYNRN